MPPLHDRFGRRITRLRLGVTDACNYRCTYCMPPGAVEVTPRGQLLTRDEAMRCVRVLQTVGVRAVRLTGGEPLVRRDICEYVRDLCAIPGIDDVALTTNGELLGDLAAPLFQAGLRRINVSLDALDPETFSRIARGGSLAKVMRGIERTVELGYPERKLNCVVMKGENDAQVLAIAEFAWAHGYTPRFLEVMPMGAAAITWQGGFVAGRETRARIESAHELAPIGQDPSSGPATYYNVISGTWSGREVGFISSVSEPFCATCDRVRITAQGDFRPCMAAGPTISLRDLLRGGASDAALLAAMGLAVLEKPSGHRFREGIAGDPSMVSIGG